MKNLHRFSNTIEIGFVNLTLKISTSVIVTDFTGNLTVVL